MANKIFDVRIRNKYDSYENWAKSSLVLELGEIAVAYTTVNVTLGNGTIEQHPELLMKVGNGEDTFADLPWLSAKAADVAAWAKAKDKPVYEAKEITGISDYIAEYVESEMGISVDTDTQYQIVKVDDYNYKLQSKGKGDSAWADVADSVIVIPNDTAAIEALQGLVGDTAVATQISNAIAALDLANTYEAKGEAAKVQTALDTYKTANDAAVQKNATDISGEIARAKAAEEANAGAITAIKDGTTIDSFKDVEEALAGKQATGDYATKTEAQAMADGKDAAIAEAKKAGTDAAAAAKAAQDDVDALEGKVGTVPEGQTVMGIITNIQENAYDDTAIRGDIEANADAIDVLEGLVGTTAVSEQISDAITALDLPNTYAPKTHKHVKADITDFAHNHEISEVNGLQDALNGKEAAGAAADALEEAKAYADGKDTAIAEAKKAGTDAQAYAEGVAGDLAGEIARATGVEGGLDTRLTAAEGKITTLNGNAETAGSVDYKIAQAVAAIMENPDETMNSINELVTWINDHAQDALELSNKVSANETAIGELEEKVGETPVADQISAAIEALKIGDYAKAADLTAAVARVAQNETDITALKGRMDTAEGDIDQLQADVALKANDAELAAVAKSGLIDDLSIGEDTTLIFDCGNSGVTA